MPIRFRTASSVAVAGLAVGASLTLIATPAGADPAPVVIDVPVTCRIEPSSPSTARETARVRVTAPASVSAGARFPVTFQADVDTTRRVPMDLVNFGFRSSYAVEGATPASLSFHQPPISAQAGAEIPAQDFTRTFTAGPAAGSITYRFAAFDYTFGLGVGGAQGVARCTPDGGPVTVTTTTVTPGPSWFERLIAALRGLFGPPAPVAATPAR